MRRDILLTVEKFHEGEESKFLIKSPKEIQLMLKAVAQKKAPVILYYDDEHQRFVKTLLLGATEQGIWLDVGPDENDNSALLNSENITVVTLHNGAKVQFSRPSPIMAIYASHPAFFFPLPEEMIRLQRRDYFRLNTTADAPLTCIIPPKDSETETPHEITIMDISVGGIALTCKENSVSVSSGEIFPDCRIVLPEIGTLTATIKIKNIFEITTSSGAIVKHAGCEFIDLDSQMSMLLQRYVAMMQNKLSGIR